MESEQLSLIELPEADLIECVKRGYRSGKIASKLEERAAKIARMVLMRASLRDIQRECHVDYRTVKAIIQIMEDTGKLPTLKTRLSQDLGDIAELSAANLREKLINNEVPANVLPIVLGIAVEKKALVDGDPTARLDFHQNIEVTPVVAMDYLDRLKQAKARVEGTKALAPAGVPEADPKSSQAEALGCSEILP